MTEDTIIAKRKTDHLRINLKEDVVSNVNVGFSSIHFKHDSLSNINLKDVDISLGFLGKQMDAPILISSMTGGARSAEEFNRLFASAAQKYNIALGVGSQRGMIQHPELESSFRVRQWAPDALIFGNLGLVQLNYGFGLEECLKAVESIEADGLIFHLNPLQEALQPEGDTNFEGLLPKLEKICENIGVPVIAKEVGYGLSFQVAKRLVSAGVAVIDIAGAGGTSWSEVERYRLSDASMRETAAKFRDWGIPTVPGLIALRKANLGVPIIASGGLLTGIDLAKSIALGASLGGYARAFLLVAANGEEQLYGKIDSVIRELKICMQMVGVKKLDQLTSAFLEFTPG